MSNQLTEAQRCEIYIGLKRKSKKADFEDFADGYNKKVQHELNNGRRKTEF